MVAQSTSGTREIAASDCFVDTFTSALTPEEILVEIRVPKAGAGESSYYTKLGRRGGEFDYPVAGAAAWVRKPNGSVDAARVALTGVCTKVVLAPGVADALVGTDGGADAIDAAAAHATEGLSIIEDLYGSVEYKTHLSQVYVKRALTAALA